MVMAVYNGEKYLAEAIESILSQTFEDFEFIIVDDGSTDSTQKVIRSYKDKRIKLIVQKNKGLSISCNNAISVAKGKYIARQDADDISLPERFWKQFEFLESHPIVGLLGTNYHTIDANGDIRSTTNVFTHPSDLDLAETIYNQFGHGTVFIRRNILNKSGVYNPRYHIANDVDLWVRISHVSKISNLVQPLYKWRSAQEGLSTNPKNKERLKSEVWEIRNAAFDHYLKVGNFYSLLSFHPLSVREGSRKYLKMKSVLFRNLSLLYAYRKYRKRAIFCCIGAIFFAPGTKRNYVQLFILLFSKSEIRKIKYESS